MNKITLNKGTANEIVFLMTNFFERIIDNNISATYNVDVEKGEPSPTLPTITTRDISSIEVILENSVYNVVGTYNYINMFAADYDSESKKLVYSMELIYKV